jgi:predicted nucleic acid-binding protein
MTDRWAADTSWLYALFDRNDQHHERAMQEAEETPILLVNAAVLAETLDLVRHRAGGATSLRMLAEYLAMPGFRVAGAPKTAPWARAARDAGVSWHDASAIATALDEGAGLRTFDKEQKKAFAALA